MSNWEYVELGDIAQIKGGKRLPKGEKLTKNRNNHPYIRVRDMNISKFVQLNQDIMYVDEKTQQKISKYTVRTNNIIISIVGTIGLVSKVHASLDNANLTENCAKIVNLNGVDSDFLYYYLSSVYGQYEIKKGIVGSTQPKFPIYNIERVKVHLPSMIIQKSIGYILSNLDEKIEINNRINQNLEKMAQAIFKHWFVDFEFPDENGKPYKSSGGEMVNNQLGMIPPKWSVNENSDVFKLLYGKALKAKNRHKGDYPVVGSNGIIGTHSDFLVKGPGIVIGRKGNPGTVNYVWNNFYPIDTTFYVQSRISLYFLYFALKRQNLNKQSTDSAVPGLSRKIAYMNLILIPDLSCIKKFDEIIDPIFRAIYQNERENVKLKVVRDTLLPKLMSGEIRVPTEQRVK